MTTENWLKSRSFSFFIHLGKIRSYWTLPFVVKVVHGANLLYLLWISAQEVVSSFRMVLEFATSCKNLYELSIGREVTKRWVVYIISIVLLQNYQGLWLRVTCFLQVCTPNMFNMELWETSGHAANYKENMFLLDVSFILCSLLLFFCYGLQIMHINEFLMVIIYSHYNELKWLEEWDKAHIFYPKGTILIDLALAQAKCKPCVLLRFGARRTSRLPFDSYEKKQAMLLMKLLY